MELIKKYTLGKRFLGGSEIFQILALVLCGRNMPGLYSKLRAAGCGLGKKKGQTKLRD